jgi:serine/threonine protein kinase
MKPPSACPGVELLELYALGRTSEAEAQRLEEHLRGCPRCVARLPSLGEGDDLVRALQAQKSKPRPDSAVLGRLQERLRGLRLSAATTLWADTNSPDRNATPSTAESSAAEEDERALLAPAQGPDEIGRLGPYGVLGVLGKGGMGIIFAAEDPQLERRIALKAIRPTLAASSDARQRFRHEAQRMASLTHDHILAIHHIGEDRGVLFLAMPLLRGESLEDRLGREGRLPLAELLRIGRETALGLAAAHERGVIHRDVKPANLWLEAPAGRIKILDFGLARLAEGDAGLSGRGVLVGTPSYMAPEQAEGRVDHRADLFSLGCVLYQMATGRLAFPGRTRAEILHAVATRNPTPPRQFNPETPERLSQLIERLLSKDRADRPDSAGVVVQALEEIERGACVQPPLGEGAFKDAWDGPTPPRIEDFLPPAETPDRLALLTELIRIDIERRLSAGEPVRLEELYLPRFPELHAAPENVVALILHEFGVRRRQEPDLPLVDYLERFPRYRNELLGQVLTSDGRPIPQRDGGAPAGGSGGVEEAALQPGKCLGSYELLARLGNGGMGTVFRARHQVLGTEFALKVLLGGRARDPQARARFLREVRAVGGLEHPNLAKATDAGEIGGILFLVTELLDGMNLKELTEQRGCWPVAAACEAMRQAAVGLQRAHEKGWVHGDVKPSNLLLTRAGVVKVLDLGLALLRGAADEALLTQPGAGMTGTPAHVAPEQTENSHQVDVQADLYSLGSTLFFLLAGRPPGRDAANPTLGLARHRSDVPAELARVVTGLLARRPQDRYATAAEVAAALAPFAGDIRLERLLGGESGVPSPAASPSPREALSLSPASFGKSTTPRLSRRQWLGISGGAAGRCRGRDDYLVVAALGADGGYGRKWSLSR